MQGIHLRSYAYGASPELRTSTSLRLQHASRVPELHTSTPLRPYAYGAPPELQSSIHLCIHVYTLVASHTTPLPSLHVPPPPRPKNDFSSTAVLTSLNEPEDTVIHITPQRTRFASAPTVQLLLPPGYTESFQGFVEVQNYSSRDGSLAAGGNKSPERSPRRENKRKKNDEV